MRLKTVLIMGVLSMLSVNSNAQNVQTILQKEILKSKVKSVHMTNGRDYVKTYFDESGKITKEESKHSTNTIYIKCDYTYDRIGNTMSYVSYSMDNPNEKLEFIYKYNDKGDLESINTPYGHTTNYEHNKKGRCIVESSSLLFPTKIKRVYNRDGQIIEDFCFSTTREELNVHIRDENGDYEKTQIITPAEGDHAFYEYNAYGDISRITIKGDTIHIDNITYDYDDRGNWIKRKHSIGHIPHWSLMEKRGVSGSLFTRTIEYYE